MSVDKFKKAPKVKGEMYDTTKLKLNQTSADPIDRVVAAFVVFHFNSLQKKWFHYWSQCKRVWKVETWSCLKTKRVRKLNGRDEKYLWAEIVYEARDFFNRLFLDQNFSLRGDTLRREFVPLTQNFRECCVFFLIDIFVRSFNFFLALFPICSVTDCTGTKETGAISPFWLPKVLELAIL